MPRQGAAFNLPLLALYLLYHFINEAVNNKAEIKASRRRVRGGGLKLSRPRVDIYLRISKVKRMATVFILVPHAQNVAIKMNALIDISRRHYYMIHAIYLHLFSFPMPHERSMIPSLPMPRAILPYLPYSAPQKKRHNLFSGLRRYFCVTT